MGEFNQMVPIDEEEFHEDPDGNDIDHLEFVSGQFDDMIVKGKDSGKYYFHDESLRFLIGPYDTEDEARDAEARYWREIVTANQEL